MGCDIHAFIEYNTYGSWSSHSAAQLPRNYAVFAALAGVRNYSFESDVPSPKGSPEDPGCQYSDAVEEYGPDAHSQSWATLKEFSEALARAKTVYDDPGYFFYNLALMIMNQLSDHFGEDNVRMVYFFDN